MNQYVGCRYAMHFNAALTRSSAHGQSRSRVVRALEYAVHTGLAQTRSKCVGGYVCIGARAFAGKRAATKSSMEHTWVAPHLGLISKVTMSACGNWDQTAFSTDPVPENNTRILGLR